MFIPDPDSGCSSWIRTPDVHPGSGLRMFIPDPDSGCSSRIRTPDVHPGSGMFIPDPGSGSLFFAHPGSRGQEGPGSGSSTLIFRELCTSKKLPVLATVADYSDCIFRSDSDSQQHSVHSALHPAAAGAESRRCIHRILAPRTCPGNHR
jgi:hypothetical protein